VPYLLNFDKAKSEEAGLPLDWTEFRPLLQLAQLGELGDHERSAVGHTGGANLYEAAEGGRGASLYSLDGSISQDGEGAAPCASQSDRVI